MSIATTIALSGINAATLRLHVAGSNIASARSGGYVPLRVNQTETADGGTSATVTEASQGYDLKRRNTEAWDCGESVRCTHQRDGSGAGGALQLGRQRARGARRQPVVGGAFRYHHLSQLRFRGRSKSSALAVKLKNLPGDRLLQALEGCHALLDVGRRTPVFRGGQREDAFGHLPGKTDHFGQHGSDSIWELFTER